MKPDYVERYDRLLASSRILQARLPGPMNHFGHLHKAVLANGVLSGKVKELIALGIAITVRCDGCIACHVHDALRAGATRDEILETIGVAVMMGGGPSMVYGTEALEALEQFEALAGA
jgi:AhpD family alkylhydroperoxidase